MNAPLPHGSQVLTKDGAVEVGRISKQWSGLLKEAFTDTDNFGISFPMDLDVKMKAVLLGALFLIVSGRSPPPPVLLLLLLAAKHSGHARAPKGCQEGKRERVARRRPH